MPCVQAITAVLVALSFASCTGAPPASAPSRRDALLGADAPSLIYQGTAFYPRAAELADGTLLATFDHPIPGGRAIGGVRSSDHGRTWGQYTRIAEDTGRVDLSNAFPLQLPNGTILVACRHHRLNDRAFGLEVYASSDSGKTWQLRSTMARGSTGLWEPFLFQPSAGVLQAYYASEEGIHPDQRIEMKVSKDGGQTWGQPITVARKTGSRDGMPGVVRLKNGDLLACFEASDTPPFGFVIRSVRSQDQGASWSAERELVYRPANSARARWSAGAPYLVVRPDGRLLASFQTDEDVAYAEGDPRRDPAHPRYAYTRQATLKYVASRDEGRSWSRPTRLAGGPTDTATWGSLYVLRDGRVLGLIGLQGQVWCRSIEPRP